MLSDLLTYLAYALPCLPLTHNLHAALRSLRLLQRSVPGELSQLLNGSAAADVSLSSTSKQLRLPGSKQTWMQSDLVMPWSAGSVMPACCTGRHHFNNSIIII
jgi:hypothetical protein